MTGHEIAFDDTLVPGWATCTRCGRTMRLAEYLNTECVPRPREEGPHEHS